jgi:transposase-like protein
MAAPKAPKPRAPRRRWPAAEKRRIVELTLRAGVSVLAIAREHGVHPNSLHQWMDALSYRKARCAGEAGAAGCRPDCERDVFASEHGA